MGCQMFESMFLERNNFVPALSLVLLFIPTQSLTPRIYRCPPAYSSLLVSWETEGDACPGHCFPKFCLQTLLFQIFGVFLRAIISTQKALFPKWLRAALGNLWEDPGINAALNPSPIIELENICALSSCLLQTPRASRARWKCSNMYWMPYFKIIKKLIIKDRNESPLTSSDLEISFSPDTSVFAFNSCETSFSKKRWLSFLAVCKQDTKQFKKLSAFNDFFRLKNTLCFSCNH